MKNKVPFKQIKSASAVKRILLELCHSHYKGDSSELDNRIEELWKVLRKTTYHKRKSMPIALLGPPGHGKTTSFKVASRMFCDAVGLDFVLNPADEQLVELNDSGQLPNCFIFISQEMAGEVSGMTVGGLPSRDKVGETEVMTKIPLMKFAMMKHAGGGCLLLDDLNNAGVSVKNVCLPILDEKRYQSLDVRNAFVGLTGNLGALDGTNVTPNSNALSNRVQTFYVEDTVEDWVMRINDEFKDEIGDALIGSFLLKFNDSNVVGRNLFSEVNNRKDGSAFASPRSWSNFAEQARGYYREARELMKIDEDISHLQEDIDESASGTVGMMAGPAIATYYHNVFTGALPIAIKQMENGVLDGKELELMKKMVSAKKNSPEGAYFSVQYANTLSDEASFKVNELFKAGKSMVSDRGEFKAVLTNYVDGVYNYGLHQGAIAQNMACFKDKMIVRSDSRRQIGFINKEGLTVVSDDFSKLMSEVVGSNYIANQPIPETPKVKLLEDTFVSVFANSAAAFNSFDEGMDDNSRKEQQELLDIQKQIQNMKNEHPKLSEITAHDIKKTEEVKEVFNRIAEDVLSGAIKENEVAGAALVENTDVNGPLPTPPKEPVRRGESGPLDVGMFNL
jgi:DNA polymerase III delta prime subunit